MLPSWIAPLADICGIIGLIFSFVIWKSTNKIKAQIRYYKASQKEVIGTLKAHRDSLIRDGLNTLDIRSKLRTELLATLQNFDSVLSLIDKIVIYYAIFLLGKQEYSNIEKLCVTLDYIIARFSKKEIRK